MASVTRRWQFQDIKRCRSNSVQSSISWFFFYFPKETRAKLQISLERFHFLITADSGVHDHGRYLEEIETSFEQWFLCTECAVLMQKWAVRDVKLIFKSSDQGSSRMSYLIALVLSWRLNFVMLVRNHVIFYMAFGTAFRSIHWSLPPAVINHIEIVSVS